MTDRDIRKTLIQALLTLTVVGLVLGVVGYLQGSPAQDGKRYYMPSDGGAVLFDHAVHAAGTEKCLTCHHHLAGEAASCQDCHEEPDYTPDEVDHDDLLEFHEGDCENCHEMAGPEEAASCRDCHVNDLAKVYHNQCTSCHLERAPERFAGAEGGPLCRSCHLR